jgi:tetratricopeptide (TPR) repeat protein
MILLELYQERGHEESALKFAYQALEILEKLSAKREMAYVLTHIPMFGGGKPPGHPRPTEEAIALFREIGDDNGAAYASQSLGFTWQSAGDPRTARTLFEESLATFLECGNLRHAAWSHMGLASLAKEAGDLEGSLRHRLEARRVFCEVGDTKGAAWADNCLGYDALLRGDLSEAEPLLVDSLAAFVKTGALQGVLIAHKNLAALYQRQSRWDEMRKAFTLALKIARQTDDRYSEVGLAEQMRVAEESIARAGHAH